MARVALHDDECPGAADDLVFCGPFQFAEITDPTVAQMSRYLSVEPALLSAIYRAGQDDWQTGSLHQLDHLTDALERLMAPDIEDVLILVGLQRPLLQVDRVGYHTPQPCG